MEAFMNDIEMYPLPDSPDDLDLNFHPKINNPERWEIIKRESAKRGLDPYDQLYKYIRRMSAS
jgi:hypothetical protein